MKMRTGQLVVIAAIALGLLQAQWSGQPPQFRSVADGVYLLTQWLGPLPVSVVLLRHGSKWALVDAGLPDRRLARPATQLLAALQATIPEGEALDAILLTHGHGDHLGALPLLLEAYPGVQVALHEDEAPFVVGTQNYSEPTDLQARLARWVGLLPQQPFKVPKGRVVLLEGEGGDLSGVGFDDKIVFAHLPVHTPGHVFYISSNAAADVNTLLAGDAVSLLRPTLALSNASAAAADSRVVATLRMLPSLPAVTLRSNFHVLCPKPHCDAKRTKTNVVLCLLAYGLRVDLMIASHDLAAGNAAGGVATQEQLRVLTRTLPECDEGDELLAAGVAAEGEEEEDEVYE